MSEESARDRLIASVTSRLNQATATGEFGVTREPEAQREAEELLGHLATADGVDQRVQYLLGMLHLMRMIADPHAGQDAALATTLLAPLYFSLPGTPDVLPAPVRGQLDRVLGSGAGRPDAAELTQRRAESLSALGMLLLQRQAAGGDSAAGRAAISVLREAADLLSAADPRRPQVLLRLADALSTAGRPGEATELLVANDAAFPPGSPQLRQAGPVLLRAALLARQLERDRDPEQRELRDLLEATLAPLAESVSGQSSERTENSEDLLAAMWKVIGGDVDPADQSRHADLMRFGNEVLATPDDIFSIPGLIAKALELASHRFSDLPPEERGEAVAGYLKSLRERKDVAKAPAPPADTGILDELMELHERLLPELAPGSRDELIVRNSIRMIRISKLQLAPAQTDPASQLRRLRALLGELKGMPGDFQRLGIAPGTIAARAAFAHTLSPFAGLALAQEWIREIRRRLAGLTPGTPEFAEARTALALILFHYATLSSDEASFAEARDIARDLAATAWPLSAALLSSWTLGESRRLQLANRPAVPPDEAGQSQHPLTRLASDQATSSLAERDATGALETLEDGRSHLLSLALNTRSEMEALRGRDAELNSGLLAVLDEMTAMQRAGALAGRLATPEEGKRVEELINEGTRLVAELRRRPGFSRFLIPGHLGLADLKPAAADGPVVTINVNPRRCDALALREDGLRTVPLPGLTARDLAEQADSFRTAVGILATGRGSPLEAASARAVFDGVLGWLWDALAEPVLEALGFTAPPGPGTPWPRIWWSPTGVLNSFPLHAAGHHDRPGASVLDRVASSYTPTIRALLLARARARRAGQQRETGHAGERRVLAVAMPETAGLAPLGRTAAEAAAAAGSGGRTLTGPEATRASVLAALPGAAVAHFACHASSDPEEPTASHLLLRDGPLPLGEIASMRLDGAELAYLSACGTTRGGTALADEAIHLASAFQLAGYAQSVGTLWEVGDAFAAAAAAAFHRALAPAMTDPAPLPAALALHATVRDLRDSRRGEPWAWAALLHAGA